MLHSHRGRLSFSSFILATVGLGGQTFVCVLSQIVGPAGCGKTQMSLMLAVIATLPASLGGSGGEVIYLDTENAFSATRLVEIATSRFPQHFADPERLQALSKAVHVSFVQTTANLLDRLGTLEEDIIQHNIKLVILDSVASLVRKEFRGNMAERTDILAREASLLKYLSASFNIPVVVTNQVTTRFDVPVGFEKSRHKPQDPTPEPAKNFVVAALGNTWSHAVNTRLIVEYVSSHSENPADVRKIKITKSPIAPFASFLYKIDATGIDLLGSLGQQAPEEYEDPMEMATIHSRAAASFDKQQQF